MRHIQRDIVGAVVRASDNKILFLKRDQRKGGVYSQQWQIPGGGIEKNETKIQALAREVMEETGLTIDEAHTTLLTDSMTGESVKELPTGEQVLCEMKFFTYQANLSKRSDEVTVLLSPEHSAYIWIDKENLASLDHAPPSVELFTSLEWM